MSYPNKLVISGIGGEHTVMNGDYLVSGTINDKPYYDRYFNDVFRGRVAWNQSINYWLLVNYDGSSSWKRIGTGDGPDGSYEPVSGSSTGTATVVANMEGIEAPVITGVVADTNSLTVSLTGVDAATHTLLYRLSTATEWTTGGTRTGNGNVTISGLSAGTYYVIAYSTLSGVNSTPGNLVPTSIQAVGVVLKEAIMAVLIDDARLDFGTSLGKLLGKHQQIPYGIYFVSPPVKPDIPFITYQFLGETDRWVDEIILNITIYSNDFDTICKRIKKLLNGKQISSLSDCRFLMCKWDWCGPDLWDDNLKVYYKNSRYIIKIKR